MKQALGLQQNYKNASNPRAGALGWYKPGLWPGSQRLPMRVQMQMKKRRREARRERPPQKEKLLRPAGYSATRQIEGLEDNLTWAVIQTVAAAAVLGLTAGCLCPLLWGLAIGSFTWGQAWGIPRADMLIVVSLVSVIALLWAVRAIQKIWKTNDDLRNWRFGMRGEQAVAEKLAEPEVAAAGYKAFHDVPGDGEWNLDHVVVGPGGVFVLETKARARRAATKRQEEQDVFFDGRVLEFPWCEDRKAAEQAKRNARWVREFLAGYGPKDLPVQPVIVVPGWYAKTKGNYPVKAMNAKYLVGYLTGTKAVLTREQIDLLVRRLDERCRTVEF